MKILLPAALFVYYRLLRSSVEIIAVKISTYCILIVNIYCRIVVHDTCNKLVLIANGILAY